MQRLKLQNPVFFFSFFFLILTGVNQGGEFNATIATIRETLGCKNPGCLVNQTQGDLELIGI